MEIRSLKLRKALYRVARLSVVEKLIKAAREESRKHAMVALDLAGIVITPGDGSEPAIHAEGLRIWASKAPDDVTLDVAEVAKRFKKGGVTIEQLLACVRNFNGEALEAVFGKGIITTTPSDAPPTISFSADENEAATMQTQRFLRRVSGQAHSEHVAELERRAAEAKAAQAEARRASKAA